ncbi:MAG: COG4280 domain-containing protein [Candidatus Baltobacteraceae bacterium]
MHPLAAALTAGLASALEFVEAATIVLAVAYTAGWRIALRATGAALAILAAICAILGPALVHYVPVAVLKVCIGIFLLLFGYTWLRKAIWRYSGRKAMRDEAAAFETELAELRKHEDRFAFATAFNGVLLEGLEVAVIVVTFAASNAGSFLWAAGGALTAGVIVAAAAAALRRPFSRVPENAMGFVVGIMLLSFGTFWSGEGFGIAWPGNDIALAALAACYLLVSLVLIAAWRRKAIA